ncbi:hypothetical protein MGYG_00437 [Nannizzia gypsea CBS 118893]|uniref:Uncharacterized protein n=1 Tax=Arthroderma gypseum (strain ATCC MYA-4604 / CBS 118893) TaxID=535722 RepID=E5QZT4_ARTGP|nr:hypothetical protein MGYG_00437 [Nannizzia gypsea CBS 118893]EFQ97397.1 hypothetical protein MGYG_00437 [Nannizzia gypsea CBS 118893]
MEPGHSSTYYRVYNETLTREYNSSALPLSSLIPAERQHYNKRAYECAEVIARSQALLAELNEKNAAPGKPTTGTASTLSSPSAATTARAPTEQDLRNQFHWHQQDYNRMHQNWRDQDARQDWNRWISQLRLAQIVPVKDPWSSDPIVARQQTVPYQEQGPS